MQDNQKQQDDGSSTQQDHTNAQENLPKTKTGHFKDGLKTIWQKSGTYRVAFTAASFGALISMMATNSDVATTKAQYENDDLEITVLNNDISILKQGNQTSLRYKFLTCPVVGPWPANVDTKLGNSGDAAFNPSDEANPVGTVLGNLGFKRDVIIDKSYPENIESLMQDYYVYASGCYDRMESLYNSTENSASDVSPQQELGTITEPNALEPRSP